MKKITLLVLIVIVNLSASPNMRSNWGEIEHPGMPRTPETMNALYPLDVEFPGFDLRRYDIEIEFGIPSRNITGKAKITVKLLWDIDTVYFDLTHLLNVDSVLVNNISSGYNFIQDSLKVPTPDGVLLNGIFEVTIFYNGSPRFGYNVRSNGYDQNVFYSFTEPEDSYGWFPCHNVPYDKSYYTLTSIVPEGYIVAGNGLLILDSLDISNAKHIYRWQENYPMAPYLFSVSIFPYWTKAETTSTGVPVLYYMYPQDSSKFDADWGETTQMIEIYEGLFGPYPFEKYGMSEVPMGWGAMEHQTCTSYGDRLIDGTGNNKWVVAHELSHQWWGDMVTCGTWKDLWLNEGFATYCEALYIEAVSGFSSFRDYVNQTKFYYFEGETDEGRFPIYDPSYLWGVTVYNKAGCVLDMLRHTVGDTIFFQILHAYADSFKYSYATTDDFKRICENVSGMDLNQFFTEWIYSPGYPELEYSWNSSVVCDGWNFTISFSQVQTDAPIFHFPLDIGLTCTDGRRIVTVNITEETQSFSFVFPGRTVACDIDPNSYVILKSYYIGTSVDNSEKVNPIEFGISSYPNPFNASSKINISIKEKGLYDLSIYNIRGEKICDIFKKELIPGKYKFEWNPKDIPSGTYFVKLNGNNITQSEKVIYLK